MAGTLVAAGVNSGAKGMAPAAPLRAWDWNNDDSEMAAAAAAGLLVSNHSYGVATGWQYNSSDGNWYWYGNPGISPVEDADFGYYNDSAADWDQIARNAPGYLVFKSAGNDRGDSGPGAGGGHYVWNGSDWVWSTATRDPDGGATGYDTLPPRSTAKNILVVGAVHDISGGYVSPGGVSPASFSSYGPTDDGRIKPDLVANGVGLTSSYTGGDASYASLSGHLHVEPQRRRLGGPGLGALPGPPAAPRPRRRRSRRCSFTPATRPATTTDPTTASAGA